METKPQRVPLDLESSVPEPLPPHASILPEAGANSSTAAEASTGLVDVGEIEEKIIAALRTCYDPEIPVNIYEMGLVYDIDVNPSGDVVLRMTLTSPACPVAGSLPPEVQAKVAAIPGVKSATVDLVWDPPWTPERMSEAARLELGMF
jgi:FeS assembly SUF system protein